MNYDTYMALYEAIYLFDRLHPGLDRSTYQSLDNQTLSSLGLEKTVYKALQRILAVHDYLSYDDNSYYMSSRQFDHYQNTLYQVILTDPSKQSPHLYDLACRKDAFFFDQLSPEEVEVYARYNFNLTRRSSQLVGPHLDLDGHRVLELGGNSGGLASGLLEQFSLTSYTIIDQEIPCQVGTSLATSNEHLIFLPGDLFALPPLEGTYDTFIMMNLLHDFDDLACIAILESIQSYLHEKSQLLIIEDVLAHELSPPEAIIQGLRLAVTCRGGRQRTLKEFTHLLSSLNIQIEDSKRISPSQHLLVCQRKGA